MWKKFSKVMDTLMWFILPLNAIMALLRNQYGEALAWTLSFILFAEVQFLKKTFDQTKE